MGAPVSSKLKVYLILVLPQRSNEGGRKGENYSVVANPSQRWFYLSDQSPDET